MQKYKLFGEVSGLPFFLLWQPCQYHLLALILSIFWFYRTAIELFMPPADPFLYYLSSSEEYCYTCFASIILYTFTHTGISEIVCA